MTVFREGDYYSESPEAMTLKKSRGEGQCMMCLAQVNALRVDDEVITT